MIIKKQRKLELFAQGLKQCPKCPKPKVLSEFGKDKYTKDGSSVYCKEHIKEYRDKPENKIKQAKHNKEFHLKNREEILRKKKIFRDKPENKAKQKKYQKDYRKNNREEIHRKDKDYRNRPKVKARINTRQQNRRKTDINYKITKYLRTRTWYALKGNSKSLNTMFLIGCDIDYLMYHLQEKFTKGMSWDNYGRGGWEIDHIKPCAKFDLSKKSEQLKCFNYTNLQPLWAEDNRKKGNKYNG